MIATQVVHAARRRPDRRAEGRRAEWAPNVYRQRARVARPHPRDALVFVLHLGLAGAARRGGGASGPTARTTRRRRRWSISRSRHSSSASRRSRSAARAHELAGRASPTDKTQYTVRAEGARRASRCTPADGKPLPPAADVAFAAVDEGAARPARQRLSWNLLDAMIAERAWGVETSTAQMRDHRPAALSGERRVAGRRRRRPRRDARALRHPAPLEAERHARRQRRGDGRGAAQRLADELSPRRHRRRGRAEVRHRQAPASASTQDLQVLAGLPPLVRDGDRFSAMLTLRNTTQREMKVRATLQGTANLPADAAGSEIRRVPISLVPQDVVLAGRCGEGGRVADRRAGRCLQHRLGSRGRRSEREGPPQGHAARGCRGPVRVLQATLAQLDGPSRCRSRAPADALPASGVKRGGLEVARAAEADAARCPACAVSSRPIPSPASSRRHRNRSG